LIIKNRLKIKKMEKIIKKIKEITEKKGYFFNEHKGLFHLNGANHICFEIIEDNIKFHTVGGSAFFYQNMNIDEFLNKLPEILLTEDEINKKYRMTIIGITFATY